MSPDQQKQKTVQQPVIDLEEERSSVVKTLISLIIGAVVLISIPALIVYLVIHFRSSSTTKKTQKASQQTIVHLSPTPVHLPTTSEMPHITRLSQQPEITAAVPQITDSANRYTDPSGFSLALPSGWKTFRRAGSDGAYQIALSPTNSNDIPATINVVQHTRFSVNDWIAAQYGAQYPRSQLHSGNADATVIQSNGLTSYFFAKNGNLYQLTTVNTANYQSANSQIISSFAI